MTGTRHAPPTLGFIELFRMIPLMRRHTLQSFTALTHRFGHIVRFKGLWTSFLLTHPHDIEHVLQTNARNYHKGRSYRVIKSATGNGLFVSEGDFWRRQRRLAQPAFHHQRIASFAQIMTNSTEEMLCGWRRSFARDEALEIVPEMMKLTLRIVGQTLFSTDLIEEAAAMGRMLNVGRDYAIRRMWQLIKLPESFPTRENRLYREAMREGDRVVYNMIKERRSGAKKDAGDLLALLMEARDEGTGEGMSDKQLRDEAITIMVAGNDTTATALSWTWYLLARHADVEQKLHAELAAVLAGRTPTFEDLPNLKYTAMVIQEALRLYPPAWILGRMAIDEDEIGGFSIPAKSEIMLHTYMTHRHTDFWDEPEKFDPERFLPERSTMRLRYSYFPFGGGPRQCIGNNFALMEAQLILATVAQKYQLRLVSDQLIYPEASVTLRPRGEMLMKLHAA